MLLVNQTLEDLKNIVYRDQVYSLIGNPIEPFFDKNPEIKEDAYFLDYSDNKWVSYYAKWLLKEDKLYLIDYTGGKFTFIDIFKNGKPVIADWFTGALEMGFGNFTKNNSQGSYDNYLWLNIKDGKVLEKKITKRFDYNPVIEFGIYKSRGFLDILHSKVYYNTISTIENYLSDLMSFLIDYNFKYKIKAPHFNIEDKEKKLVSSIRQSGCLEYFLTKNYVAIKTVGNWPVKWGDDLSLFIEKIITSDFSLLRTITKNEIEINEVSKSCILINPDIQYLNWAFKNVEFFSVPPSYLKQTFKIKILKTFKTNRLNNTILEYEPIVEEVDYKFPQHILDINQQRFEVKQKVFFNNDLGIYFENIDDSILNEKFGYYLDENFRENISENYSDYSEDYYENETFEDYNGSYAQDHENLSDQFINDVFDGDPDLYWNID
jgi:hypothetical protein